MKKVYLYSTYERFWHWTQAGLIILLALTGFEIHGTYKLLGYEWAYNIHINSAWALIGLTVLTWFWAFISGEWRQFNPFKLTIGGIKRQIQYYTKGIFKNEEHPTHKTRYTKFNPLQRLTYFSIVVFFIPLIIITGLMQIYYYSSLNDVFVHIAPFSLIVYTHVFLAYFFVAFIIGHIYLTTTGYKPLSSIKAMLSGWEEMSDEEAEYAIKEGLSVKIEEQEKEIDENSKEVLLDSLQEIEKEKIK
jgi:thiosulfate reductase cytochrome b subunit